MWLNLIIETVVPHLVKIFFYKPNEKTCANPNPSPTHNQVRIKILQGQTKAKLSIRSCEQKPFGKFLMGTPHDNDFHFLINF